MSELELAHDSARRLAGAVSAVIRGPQEALRWVIAGFLAGGHILIDDVPGTGKTTLAKALSRAVGGTLQRIQATADLMPSDVTGTGVFDPATRSFVFVPGPIFANVVVMDELNRTPPRTQSALMEAMDEGTVHVDGRRHQVPDPFLVIATQNPAEHAGTYPLPEGQLDRFAMRVSMPRLDAERERDLVLEQLRGPSVDGAQPVLDLDRWRRSRSVSRQIHVAQSVAQYAVDLVRATREHPGIRVGASSRAAIALVRCAQGLAVIDGRDYVRPEDVRTLAVAVLAHRLAAFEESRFEVSDASAAVSIVSSIVAATALPGQTWGSSRRFVPEMRSGPLVAR